MPSVSEVKQEIEEYGGFASIRLAPHLRFRAGQRRINWEQLRESIRNGEIDRVKRNRSPNEDLQYKKAYMLYVSIEAAKCVVPFYILEDGVMVAVTVMRI